MSLIDSVNWRPQKSMGVSLADGVIYPLRNALNYSRSIKVIDSTAISVQEAESSCFMRVVYAIFSLIISPFIFCALVYKSYDEELSSKRKIISDRVDSVVAALAGETVDMRDIEQDMPLVRSQVFDYQYRGIDLRIRRIRENAAPCQECIRFYQDRTREMEQLTRRLTQTEEEVDALRFPQLRQERRFALLIDRENREALNRAKEAWNIAKRELEQGIAIRTQRYIQRLELACREMTAFDFSSATEEFPCPNIDSIVRWNRDVHLNGGLQIAIRDYRRGWLDLQGRRANHINTLETSLFAIERRIQAYKRIAFDRCTRAILDNFLSYEPTLLPGFYPEELRQRAHRLQADCLAAKSRFLDRLTALEQEYAEQKDLFQHAAKTFLEHIQREGLQFEDYAKWMRVRSLYEAFRRHSYASLCLPEEIDNTMEVLFICVTEAVSDPLIEKLDRATCYMQVFDFTSANEEHDFSKYLDYWCNPLTGLSRKLDQTIFVYEDALLSLSIRRQEQIIRIEESLDDIEGRIQAYKETAFDRCSRGLLDDLMSYEPMLLPGFYPEALRQRAHRLQADCLAAKSHFQDRLTALEQDYSEQKGVFQRETEAFLEHIDREGLQFEDYDHWKRICSLYETLRKHPCVTLRLPRAGDADVKKLFVKAKEATLVLIQTQDDSRLHVNALERAHESLFFRALLFGPFKEAQEDMKQGRPILLKNISIEQLVPLLDGQFRFDSLDFSSLADLYQVALYLQLPQQIDTLEKIIIGALTDATFGAFVALAMITQSQRLVERAEHYFTQKVNPIRIVHAEVEEIFERCEQQFKTLEIGQTTQSFSSYEALLERATNRLADLERHLKSLEALRNGLADQEGDLGKQVEMWQSEEFSEQPESEKTKMCYYLERIDELVFSLPLSQRKASVTSLKTQFGIMYGGHRRREKARVERGIRERREQAERVERVRYESEVRERKEQEERERWSWGHFYNPECRNPLYCAFEENPFERRWGGF